MRPHPHPCPGNCGHTLQHWQAVCRPCFNRLPVALRDALLSARQAKAPHLEAKAAIAAGEWLRANPPAAGRFPGDDN